MANTVASINPYSSAPAYAPNFRGEGHNIYQTAALIASAAVVLPKIETFPASFLITQAADTAGNSRHGIITALTGSLIVAQGTNVSLAAAGQTIVPSISSGVITLTANGTFGAATPAAVVTVTRLT